MSWRTATERLSRLAVTDVAKKHFGAGQHQYRFAPPLTEREVARFERKHRVRLPEEYRSFLLEVGNGGAGPGYGVFPLGRDTEFESFLAAAPRPLRWLASIAKFRRPFAKLSDAFPYRERLRLAPEEIAALGADGGPEADPIPPGALPICTHGCGLRDWLVLSGEEAGHVWHDALAEYGSAVQDYCPALGWAPWEHADGRHMTFDEWWNHWLTTALDGGELQLPSASSMPQSLDDPPT